MDIDDELRKKYEWLDAPEYRRREQSATEVRIRWDHINLLRSFCKGRSMGCSLYLLKCCLQEASDENV